MFEQNKNKGWNEEQEPIVTHRGKIEKKAPRHYDVSSKKKECTGAGTVLAEPFAPPLEKETKSMVLLFDEAKSLAKNQKFMKVLVAFVEKHPDIEDVPIVANACEIPMKYANDFLDFLAENGIELEEDFDAFMDRNLNDIDTFVEEDGLDTYLTEVPENYNEKGDYIGTKSTRKKESVKKE